MQKATGALIALKRILKGIKTPRKTHDLPLGIFYFCTDWESTAFAAHFSVLLLYFSFSSFFLWTIAFMWTYLGRLLYLMLADTLQNPKSKAKLQASTAGVIWPNLTALAIGCLLISILCVHMVYTEGMKYTSELEGKNCCQYYCESGTYGDPVMHSCISAGFSHRKVVCICLFTAEGGCSNFWVDNESNNR